MAIIYCDAAAGGTPDGLAWDTAWLTLQAALNDWSTGDVIYVKQDSTVGGTATLTLTGSALTDIAPIYSANASNVYAKTSTTPNIDASDSGADIIFDAGGQYYGLYFKANDNIEFDLDATSLTLNDSILETNSANAQINIGVSTADAHVHWINVEVTSASGDQSIEFSQEGALTWEGGSYTGTVDVGGLFAPSFAGNHCRLDVRGVDFTGGTWGSNPLVDTSPYGDTIFTARFYGCFFPAGLSFTDGTFGNDGQIVEIIGSEDAGDADMYEKHTYRGTVKRQTATYVTSGSDLKADAMRPSSVMTDGARLVGRMIYADVTSTGSKTVTVQTGDNFTTAPNQNQAFLEVFYLGTASETLQSLGTSRPTDLLATTALGSGTSWTSAPTHTHKLEATVTVNKTGLIGARVVLTGQDLSAETSNDFFYDLELTVA